MSLIAWSSPTALLKPPISGACADAAGRARGRRITLLLLAIVLMSLADLLCTLTYMTSVGMLEVNPIARRMIEIAGSRQLVLFKLFTVSLSCGVIYLCRRHRRAEHMAWVCVAMMLVLMLHWVNYNNNISTLTNEISVLATSPSSEMWVVLAD